MPLRKSFVVPTVWPLTAHAALDTNRIEQITGLKGTWSAAENVFKIAALRNDVKIAGDGWTMSPFMGLASWAALTPGRDHLAEYRTTAGQLRRILTVPPRSAASGRPLQSWKAPLTRSLERLRYVAHDLQRARSDGFPAARLRYCRDATVELSVCICLLTFRQVVENSSVTMDLNKFTEKSQGALMEAQNIATRHQHQAVDVEHLMLALLQQ